MKLAVIHANPADKLSARLTLWFTGSTAYHCGFVDESDGTFFDMHLLPRKVSWPRYTPPHWVELYELPKLTRTLCESLLKRDSVHGYGVWDYLLFALRPFYHLFGQSTRNARGLICSELVANWAVAAGYIFPKKPKNEVPSPADIRRWAEQVLTKV